MVRFASSENIQISRKLHYFDLASASNKELWCSRWLHFCSTVFFHLNGNCTCKMLYTFFIFLIKLEEISLRREKNPRQTGIFCWKRTLQCLRTSFINWISLLALHSSLASSTSLAFLAVQKSVLNHGYQVESHISRV